MNENIKIKTFTGNGDWYVSLYDQINGRHIKKFYSGLKKNIPDAVRRENLSILYREVCRKYKAGDLAPLYANIPQDYSERLTLRKAYDAAHGFIINSDLAEKTKADYKSHHKIFLATAKDMGRDHAYIDQFKKRHYHEILTELSKDGSNNKYNKHLTICKSFFQYLVKNFVIDENPIHGMSQKSHRSTTRTPPTPKQQTRIIEYFREYYPPYIPWMKFIYHLKIRPAELRLLKVGMLDTRDWVLRLPHSITKNNRDSLLIIPPDIREDLLKLDLSNPSNYLFGQLGDLPFLPSPIPMSKNKSSSFWKENVKEKLCIKVDQYSLAYKGGADKMRNGMTIDDVREVFRHSSGGITRGYINEASLINMERNEDKFGKFE